MPMRSRMDRLRMTANVFARVSGGNTRESGLFNPRGPECGKGSKRITGRAAGDRGRGGGPAGRRRVAGRDRVAESSGGRYKAAEIRSRDREGHALRGVEELDPGHPRRADSLHST